MAKQKEIKGIDLTDELFNEIFENYITENGGCGSDVYLKRTKNRIKNGEQIGIVSKSNFVDRYLKDKKTVLIYLDKKPVSKKASKS